MSIRIGFLGIAHMHSWGYASGLSRTPQAQIVGVWDEDGDRAKNFAKLHQVSAFEKVDDLFKNIDAVVITSENVKHRGQVELAAQAGKHILCEKPIVTTEEDGLKVIEAVEKAGVKFMTAFPCRYSPSFSSLLGHVKAGKIGSIVAACTTNRGSCPFDWFVDTKLSGGGSMIDHVVHVTDLLRVILNDEVKTVMAQVGNRMYGQPWEDTAMLTLEFKSGVVATLDSSWSRPKSYKTWGDVTMNLVGTGGTIELDMFNQQFDVYSEGKKTHAVASYGSDLDRMLVQAFVDCIANDTPSPITAYDGLQAVRVALAGYESVKQGKPVDL